MKKTKHPETPRPQPSKCNICLKVLAHRWRKVEKQYQWVHRLHTDVTGKPCEGNKILDPEEQKKARREARKQREIRAAPSRDETRRPPLDQLTITVHAIQMVQKRARINSPIDCVEWIEKVYPLTHWSFFQAKPKARSRYVQWKRRQWGMRAPNKPTRVDIFAVEHEGRKWRFFVRGKVLLTIDYEDPSSEDLLYPVPKER